MNRNRNPKFNRANHSRPNHDSQRHGSNRGPRQQGSRRPDRPQGRKVEDAERQFLASTAVDPQPRIRLEDGSTEPTMRAMDLITPIGMGQRGLIVAPPGSGKTTILKHLCQAVEKSQPDMKLYCLLIDERPEEVTDFRRSVSAEVRWSSTDQSYDNHIRVADELMRDVFREVAEGKNVMVLVDSLTRLARVHNAESRNSGRTMSGGMDSRALESPRRIFGSARKIENGGSLSILATILIETGSRMDEVIFEEFKGTGNMEVVLSREISSQRIYPAIDISKSGTRKEELLFNEEEKEWVPRIRRILANFNAVEAAKSLVEQFEKFPTNKALLKAIQELK